jgi:hypothetical protein
MNTAPPVLTDHRIESMRSTVMLAVDHDISRRGRRARRALGLAAASVIVVGGGAFTVNALQSTGGGSADSASSGSATGPEIAGDTAGSDSKGDSARGALKEVAPQDAERDVITTGTVSVTVKDPRDVAQKVSAWVDSIGGRVDSRSENDDDGGASAFLQVRVPSTKVTAAIAHLKTYGTVNDVTLQNDDVTAQTRDLDARIDALRLSIDRLEKIMGEADTSGELIKAESALTQRQESLESLEAQRAGLADQVQLSTLSIDLSEKAKADSVEPGGFRGGLVDGWNALVSTVNNVVEVVGVLLPWAAIALVLYGVYWVATRRRGWS